MSHANRKTAALYRSLCRELGAAESLAEIRPLVRARQLGVSQPSSALISIAVHARSTWPAFVIAVGRRELGLGLGRELGQGLAAARYAVLDRWRDPQHAYRGALTELHRGVECARLLRELASTLNKPRLVRWCDDMIPRRVELIQHAEQALGWFASTADREAIRPPRRLQLSRIQGAT